MATYYFAAAFETDDAGTGDGKHLVAQYGFGVDSGNGVQALGSSGPGGTQFEVVRIPAAASGRPNQFVVSVCSNLIGVTQGQSFIRCAFRPAHDVQPASGLSLAPVTNADAQTLLNGIVFNASGVTERVNITNGTSYGLPDSSYSTQWFFPACSLAGGQPPGTSLHYEVSIEIAVLANGTTWTYYKVDPEMQIDF